MFIFLRKMEECERRVSVFLANSSSFRCALRRALKVCENRMSQGRICRTHRYRYRTLACYESEDNPGKGSAELNGGCLMSLSRPRGCTAVKVGGDAENGRDIAPRWGETSHFSVTSRHEDYISSGVNERHLDVSWLISIGRCRRSRRAARLSGTVRPSRMDR